MTKGQEDLIRYRLSRAKETLEEAKVMFQTNHPYGAANRIYYACFYAVIALLLTKNLTSSKHSGVLALFNQHFVKTGIIAVDMGKFYSRMFDNRLDSDYAEWAVVDKQDIQEELVHAEEFIKEVSDLISKQLK